MSEKTIHLTPAELAAIVADAVARAMERRPAPLSAAEKQRAYRERQKAETVTEKVTLIGETVTDVTEKVTLPSPPPLPSPAPPTLPAPTPALPPRAPARGPSKAQESEAQAKAANAEPLPLDLRADGFPEAWAEWCEHRTALARLQPSKRWTPQAARLSLAECGRHGPKLAVMAITAAISNGWQGLVWDRLQPRTTNGAPKPEPVPEQRGRWNQ